MTNPLWCVQRGQVMLLKPCGPGLPHPRHRPSRPLGAKTSALRVQVRMIGLLSASAPAASSVPIEDESDELVRRIVS